MELEVAGLKEMQVLAKLAVEELQVEPKLLQVVVELLEAINQLEVVAAEVSLSINK